jgi:AAA+ superfamily predicted ATPase
VARADLLLNLVRAALAGDEQHVRAVVEALAAEERQKRHPVLADQLADELARLPHRPRWEVVRHDSPPVPHSALLEVQPKLRLGDLVLPAVAREDLYDLIEEQHRADLLRTYNLEPRHRVLLTGPPGNGKTSTAEAIAAELALPLLVLRYEEVITSFLGETSARLESALEDVRRRHCVFFLDEFDAVAKERADAHETGEIKRVVSSLLLQLDRLPSYVVVCAATNHPELLDRAVWRRFQVRVHLPTPTRAERAEYMATLADRLGVDLGLPVRSVTDKLEAANYSDLREFVLELLRHQILRAPSSTGAAETRALLARWKVRSRQGQVQAQDDSDDITR